jgi:hypothetical protein
MTNQNQKNQKKIPKGKRKIRSSVNPCREHETADDKKKEEKSVTERLLEKGVWPG